MSKLRQRLLAPFTWLLALLFLIEEAIWDATAALMARLGALRLVHALEARIAALPPRWALFTFTLPSITLIPAKLLGLHAMASGHFVLGITILGTAKLLGMALFSRIFNLTRPALMQLPWFVRLYDFVMRYRNRIHAYLAAWPAYQRLKHHLQSLLAKLKSFFKRRT